MFHRPLAVVTLSRFVDIWKAFSTTSGMPVIADRRVVVADELPLEFIPLNWECIQAPQPFNFARNTNLGMDWVEDCDVLLVNDDVAIGSRYLVKDLQELAYSDLDVGILSPKVIGEIGSGEVKNAIPQKRKVVYCQNYIPFVCVFMRREVIDRVGPLDEGYVGYGGEDIDYCERVKAKGYRWAVAPDLVVNHLHCHSSFERVGKVDELLVISDKYHRSKYEP